jgi:hypothetical protein
VTIINCGAVIAGPFYMAAQFPVILSIGDFIPGERACSIDGHTSKAIVRCKAYINSVSAGED